MCVWPYDGAVYAREAEIRELHFPQTGHQDVLGLEVAVKNALAVQISDSFKDLVKSQLSVERIGYLLLEWGEFPLVLLHLQIGRQIVGKILENEVDLAQRMHDVFQSGRVGGRGLLDNIGVGEASVNRGFFERV